MKSSVSKKKTVHEKLDELAKMMAEGFSAARKYTDEKFSLAEKNTDKKIDELAAMMANSFTSFQDRVRTEFHNEISGLCEEMRDSFVSVRRDILSIRDVVGDHELRITTLEQKF